MTKKIFYQIHTSKNQTKGCFNNGFTFPFFKKGGFINGQRAYFNQQIEVFVMNDKNRKQTGHGGIYVSKVPYSIISLHEIIEYNNYIVENVSFKFKTKYLLNKLGVSFKKQNEIKSKVEFLIGFVF